MKIHKLMNGESENENAVWTISMFGLLLCLRAMHLDVLLNIVALIYWKIHNHPKTKEAQFSEMLTKIDIKYLCLLPLHGNLSFLFLRFQQQLFHRWQHMPHNLHESTGPTNKNRVGSIPKPRNHADWWSTLACHRSPAHVPTEPRQPQRTNRQQQQQQRGSLIKWLMR